MVAVPRSTKGLLSHFRRGVLVSTAVVAKTGMAQAQSVEELAGPFDVQASPVDGLKTDLANRTANMSPLL